MSAAPLLTILKNGQTLKSVPLEGDVSVGRAEGNVIRLDDRAISRSHALFRASAGGIEVQKKSDFAPLKVNGAECTSAVVREGDLIELGPYLVRLTGASASATAPVLSAVAASLPPPSGDGATLPVSALAPGEAALGFADTASAPESGAGVDSAAIELPPLGAQAVEPAEGDAFAAAGGDFALDSGQSAAEAQPSEGGTASESPAEVPGFELAGAALAPPAERTAMVADDAATRVGAAGQLAVRLVFKPGDANVTELEIRSDEISIGRGKNCDVVLNDKKASRKHALVRRAGLQFTIKDLESANGTYVDGERIPGGQDVELPGLARIQIGNVAFEFVAESQAYRAQEAQLPAPVPETVEPLNPEPAPVPELQASSMFPDALANGFDGVATMPPIQGVSADVLAQMANASAAVGTPVPGLGGVPGLGATGPADKSLLAKFKALPQRTRMLVILVAGAAIYYAMDEGILTPEMFGFEGPKKVQKQAAKPAAGAPGSSAQAPKTFETLRPEQKQFVEAQHQLAFEYFKNQEWDQVLFALDKIFALIPNYKDAREMEHYAKEGKKKREAREEERKRLEEEERIKSRISALVEEASEAMKAKDYERARGLFGEILTWDPDNAKVAEWKAEFEAYEERQRLDAQRKQVVAEINRRAWGVYKDAVALTRSGKWYASQPVFREVLELKPTDRKLVAAAKTQLAAARGWIKARRDPLLQEAMQLEKEKQYAPAYKLYSKAAAIDPSHPAPPAGIRRVRGVLHAQAKDLYTEAVLAESYSDFSLAKRKYEAVLATAPIDDVYHERATRKLSRFVRFEQQEGEL